MGRSEAWNQEGARKTKGAKQRWLWISLGLLAILVAGLLLAGLRASVEGPRRVEQVLKELSTETGARRLYRATPGLQAGYGSEAAFLDLLRRWQPRFGETRDFGGPDRAKRFLPFATKLEVQGSGGAWFALLAREAPFPKLHGIAFGADRLQARQTCFALYAKTHFRAWLDRGVARAHAMAEQGLGDAESQRLLRALPAGAGDLDPATFAFQFTESGACLEFSLGVDRMLRLTWKGESPESEIVAELGPRPLPTAQGS